MGVAEPGRYNMSQCYIDQMAACILARLETPPKKPVPSSTTTTRRPTTTPRPPPPLASWMLTDDDDYDEQVESGEAASDVTIRPSPVKSSPAAVNAVAETTGQVVLLKLEVLNTTIAEGLQLVNSKLKQVLDFSASLYEICDSKDEGGTAGVDSEASEPETEASLGEAQNSTNAQQEPEPESPAGAAEEGGLVEEQEESRRNKRDGPLREKSQQPLLFYLDKRGGANSSQTEAFRAVRAAERVMNATALGMRADLTKLPGVWSKMINATMERIRQELMQVPVFYIAPLVERVESRVTALENFVRKNNIDLQRTLDRMLVEARETKKVSRRVEELMTNSTAETRLTAKRWADLEGGKDKTVKIFCNGRLLDDPCHIDDANLVFGATLSHWGSDIVDEVRTVGKALDQLLLQSTRLLRIVLFFRH